MLLLVGLGNPGAEYARNRHNIGFMAVDEVVRRHSFTPFRSKFKGEISDGSIAGEKVMVLKPQTFMNESGQSVGDVIRFYKIAPEDVIVVHDELDLDAGKMRIKRGGGHAGHNGLRSIQSHIGADFRRVRLGIGHPGDKDKVTGHVLNDFAKGDDGWLTRLLDGIADHASLLIEGNEQNFMTQVASAVNPPKPKKEPKKESKKDKPEAGDKPTPLAADHKPTPLAAKDKPKEKEPAPSAIAAALSAAKNKFKRKE